MSWTKVVLGECVNITSGPAFKSCEFTSNSSDIPLVKGENVGQGIVLWEKSKYWPRNDLLGYEKFKLEPGDVVLAMDRPWVSAGLKYAVISERDPQALLVQRVARIRAINGLETRFLRHIIASPQFCAYIKGIMGGTNVPHISGDQIRAFSVTMPPIQIQQRIADILSAYDDLIENNRRRIQLLEQSARLLYEEWFVHLRFPGHEHVPIVDGVPEGWSEGVVSDFYSTSSGGTPSRKNKDYYSGEIPWVKSRELNGGFILSTEEQITADAISRSSARLFPRHTLLVAMYGATIGQLAVLSIPSTTNQACCAVLPREPGTSLAHARFFFSHHKSDLVGLGQGAAQNNISQERIKTFRMVLPRKPLLEAFSELVLPILGQIEALERTNSRLAKARDLLLPRLMNGEMPV